MLLGIDQTQQDIARLTGQTRQDTRGGGREERDHKFGERPNRGHLPRRLQRRIEVSGHDIKGNIFGNRIGYLFVDHWFHTLDKGCNPFRFNHADGRAEPSTVVGL